MTPLFVQNPEDLKAALRLSAVCEGNDAQVLIDRALQAVREHFYRRLGQPRMAQLILLPPSIAPTTADEILRSIAETTEIKWVRLELLDSMPTMFMDGSNNTLEEWDEAAPFRSTSSFQIAELKKTLFKAIEENLDMLAGRETQGDETTVQVFDGTPESVRRPFDSVRNIKSFY